MRDIRQIESQLAAAEAAVPGLRPGCEKRVIWAGRPTQKTATAVVFVHGFSATGNELRPLPDLVAQGLNANLYLTRLTGHGQDGEAMAQATLADWQRDVADALDIGRSLGDDVIVMGCSTGCTLITLACAAGADAKAVVHVSPNFGLRHLLAQALLDMPAVRHWGHLVAGKTRSFLAINDAHAAYWTLHYPLGAVYPMGNAVREVRRTDLSQINVPAYFAYNPADQVVDARQIRRVIDRWGGATRTHILRQGPDDDAMGHVMAGDVFSPQQTVPLAKDILHWLGGL